jgi:GT2 family glycosyltransferase
MSKYGDIDTPKGARAPFTSIIVINYNGYKWLEKFMPYLLKTNYPSFEIIVVENGSTDKSLELLRSFDQNIIRIIELKENFGFAEGCNKGIRVSHGEILAFLNNDVQVDRNWLRAAVDVLVSDSTVGAVQSKMMSFYDKEKIDCVGMSIDKYGIVFPIGHNEKDEGQYDNLAEIGGFCGGAMVTWKELLIEVGLFDSSLFLYYEDVDLSWRLKLMGYRILPAHRSIVYHVGSATSKKTPSSIIVFNLTRNHIVTWLKNSSRRSIIMYWPVVVFIVLSVSLFNGLRGGICNYSSGIKSFYWIFLNLNYIIKERNKIQKLAKIRNNNNSLLFVPDSDRKSSNLSYLIDRALFLVKAIFKDKVHRRSENKDEKFVSD